jgi:hypothetical protein
MKKCYSSLNYITFDAEVTEKLLKSYLLCTDYEEITPKSLPLKKKEQKSERKIFELSLQSVS